MIGDAHLVPLFDIQDFLSESLKNNVEFDNLCNSLIGSSLNFFIDRTVTFETTDNTIDLEPVPFIIFHKNNKRDFENEWEVQFQIVLENNPTPIVSSNGVTYWETPRHLEVLGYNALKVINSSLNCHMFGDIKIALDNSEVVTEEVTESRSLGIAYMLTLTSDNYI